VPQKSKELLPTLKQLQRHNNNPKLSYIIEVIGPLRTIFNRLYFRKIKNSHYNCYYVKYPTYPTLTSELQRK
jgi:hypothetical protein